MAKKKGAEAWKIPTENEVNELYSDSERFNMHKKRVDAVEGVEHKKTIEDTFQEKKNNFLLIGIIILGVIIAMIIISVFMVISKGKKGLDATQSGLNRHNTQTMEFEDEENMQSPESENQYNNNYPQGQQIPQQTYPQNQQFQNNQAYPQGQQIPQQAYPQNQQMPQPPVQGTDSSRRVY